MLSENKYNSNIAYTYVSAQTMVHILQQCGIDPTQVNICPGSFATDRDSMVFANRASGLSRNWTEQGLRRWSSPQQRSNAFLSLVTLRNDHE
jgi:hypothetical protein